MTAVAKTKRSTRVKVPSVGAPFGGGFYAGRMRIDGAEYALIVAPKVDGQHDDAPWSDDSKDIKGALSFCDGRANTAAMAKAGSKLAAWAQGLRIGGFDDWYVPSLDELEICYRNLKPSDETNSLYARSGINLSPVSRSKHDVKQCHGARQLLYRHAL